MSDLGLQMLMSLKDEASDKIDALNGKVEDVGKTGEEAGKGVGGIGAAAMILGGAGIIGSVVKFGGSLMDLVDAAAEEEKGIALLGNAVRNTGADWDVASEAIETYLTAELARTALDDGDGRAAIQRLTEATGDYETALDLMALTQDLAASKGIDLAMAADIVGKVHAGNLGSLSRYGIVLEEGTTATGALEEMTKRFGGAAEAAGQTYEASGERVGIAMGNIKETIGGALMEAVQPITEGFADMAMRALPLVEGAIEALKPVFAWLLDDGKPIMIGLAIIVGTVLVAAFVAMGVAAWAAAAPVIAAVGAILVPLLPFIAIVVGIVAIIALVRTAWEKDWGGIQEKTQAVLDWLKAAWETVSGMFVTAFTVTLPNLFNSITAIIKKPFQDGWDFLVGLWGGIGDWLRNLFGNIHIPLPHFGINWTEVLGVRIPSGVSVDWYGAGANFVTGGPMMIGVGERGPERVIVQPLAGGDGAGSGATYQLTYNDYRDKGGPPDLLAVARALEWQVKMGQA